MYYIDDYNSKAVTNAPPQRQMVAKLKQVSDESKKAQLDAFWNLMGITIAERFEDVKELLAQYGYVVANEEDAAVAISEIWATPKWMDFVKSAGILIESTIDNQLLQNLAPKTDEASFVGAIIAAVGAIVGGSLGLASSNKQLKATKENAKTQMIAAIAGVQMERERAATEREKANAGKTKALYWILGITIISIVIIVAIIIYKRKSATT